MMGEKNRFSQEAWKSPFIQSDILGDSVQQKRRVITVVETKASTFFFFLMIFFLIWAVDMGVQVCGHVLLCISCLTNWQLV